MAFSRELDAVIVAARANGTLDDPVVYDHIMTAWVGLQGLRHHALRTMGGTDPTAASVAKLLWATWHQRLGELAMAVQGAAATVAEGPPYELTDAQRLFLFTRADTIYGGSHEIQRNIVADRLLGRVAR